VEALGIHFEEAFIMGGKSESKSSNSQTTNTDNSQTDNRIGAAEGAIVAAEGSSINIDSLDPALVEAALTQGYGFAENALERFAGLKGVELDAVADVAKGTAENAQSLKTILKYGTAVAGMYFLWKAYK